MNWSGPLRGLAAVLLFFPSTIFSAATNTAQHGVAAATNNWTEVTADEMDVKCLTKTAKRLLSESGDKWRQAQTDHYVVHFFASEGDLGARKTAAMAEFFYNYVPKDLGFTHDLLPGRSHIFNFRNEYRWKKFLKTVPDVAEWGFSFAEGPSLFLQQAENSQEGAHNVAHETTHMVLFRFMGNVPPLWLNEGTAEYYGEFGLAEFRGLKRYSGNVFKGLREPMPLKRLLATIDKYPEDKKEVHKFYETAKYFVGFLMTKKPHDRFSGFLKDMTADDAKPMPLLEKYYGYTDLEAVQKDFAHFCR